MRVWPGGVGPRVAEAAAQNPRQLQAQLLRELPNLVLRLVDQIAARFGVLLLDERIANRPDAAAEPAARVDDGDLGAVADQIARRGQAGEPGADDEDLDARPVDPLTAVPRDSPSP